MPASANARPWPRNKRRRSQSTAANKQMGVQERGAKANEGMPHLGHVGGVAGLGVDLVGGAAQERQAHVARRVLQVAGRDHGARHALARPLELDELPAAGTRVGGLDLDADGLALGVPRSAREDRGREKEGNQHVASLGCYSLLSTRRSLRHHPRPWQGHTHNPHIGPAQQERCTGCSCPGPLRLVHCTLVSVTRAWASAGRMTPVIMLCLIVALYLVCVGSSS